VKRLVLVTVRERKLAKGGDGGGQCGPTQYASTSGR
jgi:hypothetical protein